MSQKKLKNPKIKKKSGDSELPNRLRILVANGVNLDLLGQREPDHYGYDGLGEIEQKLSEFAAQLHGLWPHMAFDLSFFQSNDERTFLEHFDQGWDGVILNAGAWTHTSLALADRLAALKLPFVEVHLSNLARREDFRHKSYAAAQSLGVVYGFGADSYLTGLVGLLLQLQR